MIRVVPRSLLGQMILLMGAALLIAQLFNLAYMLNEQRKLSLAQNEGPAITRFATSARQIVLAHERDRDWRSVTAAGTDFSVTAGSRIATLRLTRSSDLEARLARALAEAGVSAQAIEASSRIEGGNGAMHNHVPNERKVAYFSIRLEGGQWLNGRLRLPAGDLWMLHRMLVGTALLYLFVLGVAAWGATRITRPMRDLADAAERFERLEEVGPVTVRGPPDVRRAINAFNAMNARVSTLLDQKDRMLGAIGHDLRTPLASMRIRAETMEPAAERTQLFASIDDMAEMLEDILTFARTGRPREPVQKVDLGALAEAVVEEFRAMGRSVEFRPGERVVLAVQPSLLRRAVRNLVENACTHGGNACTHGGNAVASVNEAGGDIAITIEDDGPGIPADRLDEALKPFQRLDPARNRATGGAGLGLAIAAAVAQAHGGRLELENRVEGGLRARLVLEGSFEHGG